MVGTPSPDTISTKQRRIAELAKQAPGMSFTTLAHHIDIEWMKEAFRRTRKDGATGIDGKTAEDYGRDLDRNLAALIERAKSGQYRAPPVRRAHIPKGNGETRPIGIPTIEDKVLQRSIVMVLEPIYEQDFRNCSYGFRPGRSAHDALDDLWNGAMKMGGGWVLDVDIRKFFDTLDHRHIQELLRHRVSDGVVCRLVGKWLNAGVMEDGAYRATEKGTPQGGVISPLLANIYLHEVLDVWFEDVVLPRLNGHAFLIRYADDFVMVFATEDDARRVQDVLPKRLGKYGLAIHPDKTRLVRFARPKSDSDDEGNGTFNFLGFTHVWRKSRGGGWHIHRRTAADRLTRSVKRIAEWCKMNRHLPMRVQHATLSRKVTGHYGYFGITGNSKRLALFHWLVTWVWRKWLLRRSQRRPPMDRFIRTMERFQLPAPRLPSRVRRMANP